MTKINDGISTSHILGFLFCDIALIKQSTQTILRG